MADTIRSRRGVYYDLNLSPYEFTSPYGDVFKFSSAKKLEMYTRDVVKEIDRMTKVLDRNGLQQVIPQEIISLLYRSTYEAFYNKIEG